MLHRRQATIDLVLTLFDFQRSIQYRPQFKEADTCNMEVEELFVSPLPFVQCQCNSHTEAAHHLLTPYSSLGNGDRYRN